MHETLGIQVMVTLHITIDPNAMTRLDILFLSWYWHNNAPCSRQGPIDAHAHHLQPNRDAAHQSATGVAPLFARPRGVVRPAAGNVCRTPSTTVGRRHAFLALFRKMIQHQSCSHNAYPKQFLPILVSCVHFPLCAYSPLYPIVYVQKVRKQSLMLGLIPAIQTSAVPLGAGIVRHDSAHECQFG